MNRFAVSCCCAASALVLLSGCGGKVQDQSSDTDPGAGISSLSAPDLGAMPSDDQAASDAVPPAAGFDFSSSQRPTNEQGEEISDLAILNDALLQYLDPTARGIETAVPLPKDLNDLVRAGFLKNLPKPPPGKKFVLDARRVEIRLENQ